MQDPEFTAEDGDFLDWLRGRPQRPHDPESLDALEDLQQAAFESQPNSGPLEDQVSDRGIDGYYQVDPSISDYGLGMVEEFRRDLFKAFRKPTGYEPPDMHLLLQMLVAKIERELEEPGIWAEAWYGLEYAPIFGIMVAGQTTARTISSPNGRCYLVLVDQELFLYLNLMAKIVAQAVPVEYQMHNGEKMLAYSHNADDIRAHVHADGNAVKRFLEVVGSFTLTGRTSPAPQYLLPPERQPLANNLREASELFIVGHEYSHILRDHPREPIGAKGPISKDSVSRSLWALHKENMADMEGYMLAAGAIVKSGVPKMFARWGADLYLHSCGILRKALGVLSAGEWRGMNEARMYEHAEAYGRADLMDVEQYRALQQLLSKEDAEVVWSRSRSELTMVSSAFAAIWEVAEQELRQWHLQGARPAPIWLQ